MKGTFGEEDNENTVVAHQRLLLCFVILISTKNSKLVRTVP